MPLTLVCRPYCAGIDGFAYACAVLLAAVFVVAGAAKLARPAETVAGFSALGLPAARVLGRAVPLAELAVAVTLLALPAAGGASALVLLTVFTAVLVRAIRSGTTAPCNCFGAAAATPVSGADVARNAALAALAVAALDAGGPVVPSLPAAGLLAAASLAGLALLRRARRT